MSEIRAEAFLFDMDGTLIDSIASAERIWSRWARRHGLEVATFLPTIHGARAIDTIARLGLPGVDPVAEARQVEQEEIEDLEGVVAIAGAADFLSRLPAQRWTIVTSAPRALAFARLAKAGLSAPASMVAGQDIPAGKPAPDCYLLGAERLGADIRRCIVFEDAPVGIQAAEAAGAGLVVVGAAHHYRAEHPLFSIDSYADLRLSVEPDGLVLSSA